MDTPRRRLPPGQRRLELVRVAGRQFATRPFGEVSMSAIAEEAGVSRALLYRYFPAKRDLFAAVYREAARRLVAASSLPVEGSVLDQVEAGLDAHFDFFEANARTVLVANRGEMAGDPVVEAIITDELVALRQVLLDRMQVTGEERIRAGTALVGWLAFVRGVCVDWLAEGILGRPEVKAMCLRTLLAALGLDPTEADQTGPDPTEADQTAPDQTAPDPTEADQTAPDQTAPDPTGPDPTEADQTAPDQTAPDPTAPDPTGPDPTEADQTGPDQTGPDRAGSDVGVGRLGASGGPGEW